MTIFQIKVDTIKAVYPKFSEAALSMALRSYETGVQLTPAAQLINDRIDRNAEPYIKPDNRVKRVRFMCRLTPTDAEKVKTRLVEQNWHSVQNLVEHLLMEWVKSEPPASGIADGRARGKELDALPRESITETNGGQYA